MASNPVSGYDLPVCITVKDITNVTEFAPETMKDTLTRKPRNILFQNFI